ncbi:MAG: response regulator [Lachnospiraceae bacterium]|nr:response regulator [Lachnospiraceae bacterium]
MKQVILGIQCANIIIAFIECWVVFQRWRGRLHSYLFLSCISTLLCNAGYLGMLYCGSEESYFIALSFGYLGKLWVAFSLFMFVSELTRFRIPPLGEALLALMSAVTFVFMATTRQTELYYTNIRFEMEDGFPVFSHGNGIWHHVWMVMLLIYITAGLVMHFLAFRREKHPGIRKRLIVVLMAVFSESLFTVIYMFRLFPITRVYDVSMIGFTLGTIFMFIAILRYNLMDMEGLAREYVIDELSEGIIAVNERNEVSYFNKPALQIFPSLNEDAGKVTEQLRGAILAGEPLVIAKKTYTPEQNPLYQNGTKAGTVFVLVDDTEHYRYMKELEEQKKIADNANKAKSTFLANMSHEIRTPINAILGMDEMILRESREEAIQSYAADIETAGRTLLSLINDILDFSKIEEGRMEILPVQYELSSMIGDLVNMIRGRAEKKGLRLAVSADKEMPHLLYGDEIRIRQVALNLLTNAVKYTDQGWVGLKVGFHKCSEEEVRLIFQISDTGIGMKEEDMDRLFSPFSRIEEERNRTIEGTGLGMSIVKQLLSLMGSELQVRSIYGEGSVFYFEILQKVVGWEPMGDIMARIHPEAGERKAYRELFHAPDARLLMVDDTEVNLTVVKNLLKKTEIQIDTAASGEEALSLTEKKDYDIILVDIMMPGMDGTETLRRMKRQERNKTAAFIALTANAVSGARETYLKEGFTDYLSKPVEGIRLEKTLRKYLPEEKLLPVGEGGAEDAGEPEESRIPAWLWEIPELDVKQGVLFCGSEESFLEVLSIYHQTAKEKADEIESLMAAGDVENYSIKVHALKSSSRTIGAMELSAMAERLEKAGKEGDKTTINRDTGELLIRYRSLDEKLAGLDQRNEDLLPITPEMRNEAFQTIGEIADSMDFGMMEEVLKEIKAYRLDSGDEEAIKRIEGMLMRLDWEEIVQEVRKLLG